MTPKLKKIWIKFSNAKCEHSETQSDCFGILILFDFLNETGVKK